MFRLGFGSTSSVATLGCCGQKKIAAASTDHGVELAVQRKYPAAAAEKVAHFLGFELLRLP